MNYADREGTFRAEITDYGLKESQQEGSKSVGVDLHVKLTAMYHEGEWHPWADYDQTATGTIWVIGRDGHPNKLGCESLGKHAGWDFSLEHIDDKTWQPTPCQVVLKAEEYNGKTRYKIAFVNGYDDVPGGTGVKSIGPEKVKSLAAQYGSQLRALKGTAAQNKSKPTGKPPAPPKQAPAQEPEFAADNGDSIPF